MPWRTVMTCTKESFITVKTTMGRVYYICIKEFAIEQTMLIFLEPLKWNNLHSEQRTSLNNALLRNYEHQTPLQSALKPRAKSWFASPGPRCILGHVVFSRGRKHRSCDHYRVPPRGVALRRVRWALSFTPEDSIRPTAITRTRYSLIDRKVLKVRIRRAKPVLFGFVGWRNGVIFI